MTHTHTILKRGAVQREGDTHFFMGETTSKGSDRAGRQGNSEQYPCKDLE